LVVYREYFCIRAADANEYTPVEGPRAIEATSERGAAKAEPRMAEIKTSLTNLELKERDMMAKSEYEVVRQE
jgi:hypothetical protein